jgi:glyoxylate utilization-related uncharacterized protein
MGPSAKLVDLPIVHDVRGNLTVVEGGEQIPFDIARIYYLYDVPGGSERGGHGHRELEQLIIAMSGSFDVRIHDGETEQTFSLNRSYRGVYVPPMSWRVIDNFSSGAVCLVLASRKYEEADYIRDFDAFVAEVQAART